MACNGVDNTKQVSVETKSGFKTVWVCKQ
jgi:hypothetical protein